MAKIKCIQDAVSSLSISENHLAVAIEKVGKWDWLLLLLPKAESWKECDSEEWSPSLVFTFEAYLCTAPPFFNALAASKKEALGWSIVCHREWGLRHRAQG